MLESFSRRLEGHTMSFLAPVAWKLSFLIVEEENGGGEEHQSSSPSFLQQAALAPGWGEL